MQIAIGDIWTKMSDDSSAVCVTTNGIWKKNGLAVMGKGKPTVLNNSKYLNYF